MSLRAEVLLDLVITDLMMVSIDDITLLAKYYLLGNKCELLEVTHRLGSVIHNRFESSDKLQRLLLGLQRDSMIQNTTKLRIESYTHEA